VVAAELLPHGRHVRRCEREELLPVELTQTRRQGLLADEAQCEALVAATVAAFGRIDVMVNNAGIGFVMKPMLETSGADWDRVVDVNLKGAFLCSRAAARQFIAQGPGADGIAGRIINIASAHALVASPFKGAYVAAKHGVLGLTKTVALEGATFGITCNAICPGYVKTPLVEAQIADQAKARGISEEQVMRDVILAAQPTKKFVQFSELAGMLLYLASDLGASVNGAGDRKSTRLNSSHARS
jgi:3-hydroxybutyrate dehydrogenase